MSKKLLLFLWILLLAGEVMAQTPIRFARKYLSSYEQPEFRNLLVTDSCYWVSGWFRDSVYPWAWTSRFVKISIEGEILQEKKLVSFWNSYGWPEGIFHYDNKLFSVFLQPYYLSHVLAYDIALDSLYNYYSYGPLNPKAKYLFGNFIFMNTEGDMYCLGSTSADSTLSEYNTDIQLIKLDKDGRLLFSKQYKIRRSWQVGLRGIKQMENGQIYIYGRYKNSRLMLNSDDNGREYVLILNENGDSLKTIIGKSYYSAGVHDIYPTDDGHFIYGSAILEHGRSPMGVPAIIKMDSFGNAKWNIIPDSTLRSDAWFIPVNVNRILRKSNGHFTALAGIEVLDTLDPIYPYEDWRTSLIHFTENGEKIWQRNYSFGPGGEQLYGFDLKPTLDGGYSFCGLLNLGTDSAYQYSVLIKTDSMGCVVPGCHETVSTSDISIGREQAFISYPNPIRIGQPLVILSRISSNNGRMSLHDLQGREVLSRAFSAEKGVQYLVDIPASLLVGVYILKIHSELGVWEEKISVIGE